MTLDIYTKVPPGSHAVVVMAKAPVSGAVKSRLVLPLTDEEAAALNHCFISDICASIKATAAIQAAAAIVAAQENTPVAGRNASAVAGNADVESENARVPDSNADSMNRRRLLPARPQPPHSRIFEDITWSTSAVLTQTLQRVAELRLIVL